MHGCAVVFRKLCQISNYFGTCCRQMSEMIETLINKLASYCNRRSRKLTKLRNKNYIANIGLAIFYGCLNRPMQLSIAPN
jgi:hypothetical protein